MNLITAFLFKLWNARSHLLLNMIKRSTVTSYVQKSSDLSPGQLKEQNRWPWYRILLYFYLSLAVGRFLFAGYVMHTGKRDEIAQWDVLMRIGVQMKLINLNTCIFCSPLTIFGIYFDYTVYVKRYNNIIQLAHDAAIRNPADFFTLNPAFNLKPEITLRAPISSVKSVLRILYWFIKPPANLRITWSAPVLPYYPNLDEKIRLRSLLVNWFLQLFIAIFLFCTSKSLSLRACVIKNF